MSGRSGPGGLGREEEIHVLLWARAQATRGAKRLPPRHSVRNGFCEPGVSETPEVLLLPHHLSTFVFRFLLYLLLFVTSFSSPISSCCFFSSISHLRFFIFISPFPLLHYLFVLVYFSYFLPRIVSLLAYLLPVFLSQLPFFSFRCLPPPPLTFFSLHPLLSSLLHPTHYRGDRRKENHITGKELETQRMKRHLFIRKGVFSREKPDNGRPHCLQQGISARGQL